MSSLIGPNENRCPRGITYNFPHTFQQGVAALVEIFDDDEVAVIVEDIRDRLGVAHDVIGECAGIKPNRAAEMMPMRVLEFDGTFDTSGFIELHIQSA